MPLDLSPRKLCKCFSINNLLPKFHGSVHIAIHIVHCGPSRGNWSHILNDRRPVTEPKTINMEFCLRLETVLRLDLVNIDIMLPLPPHDAFQVFCAPHHKDEEVTGELGADENKGSS